MLEKKKRRNDREAKPQPSFKAGLPVGAACCSPAELQQGQRALGGPLQEHTLLGSSACRGGKGHLS